MLSPMQVGELTKDFNEMYVILAIAFRIHKGKPKVMRGSAKLLRKRFIKPETKKILDLFIKYPEKSEEYLTALTVTLNGKSILHT